MTTHAVTAEADTKGVILMDSVLVKTSIALSRASTVGTADATDANATAQEKMVLVKSMVVILSVAVILCWVRSECVVYEKNEERSERLEFEAE